MKRTIFAAITLLLTITLQAQEPTQKGPYIVNDKLVVIK